jgi:biotin-(acetyl-CoA carboxylase) ligase
MHLPDPQFPPLLEGHAVKAPQRPFDHAVRQVRRGRLGAGDVVWSRNTARAELAVVLEPDVALERALQMGPLLMVALVDCLGALCPPKVAIQHRWPGTLLLNGAAAGGVRLGAPRGALSDVPPWLVIEAGLQIAAPREERQDWSETSLSEEAGSELDRTAILQSLAAHFLTWLNIWTDDGFRPVHDQWLFRTDGRESPLAVPAASGEVVEGLVLGLDESGSLLLKSQEGKVMCLPYLERIELLDPA